MKGSMSAADHAGAPVLPASKPARPARVPAEPKSSSLGVPLAFVGVLVGLTLVPPVREHARLAWTFVGAAGFLLGWLLLVRSRAARSGRVLVAEFTRPLKAHYIQASMQFCVYAYWALYWPKVASAAPLIAAQLAFLYLFDGLLSWSRGRTWRIGFGPVPIIFSTNLFLWFKDDWFALQFAMVASCALAKEFLRWNRDGKNTHIFNPSAFGLGLFSIILIVTGTTHYTWGVEVASTLGLAPYMYVLIFCVGLVVQYFFSVTLMTLSAVATLTLLDLAYFGSTGLYQFVDTNIPIAIFLGMHLLFTDPSTSPRTNVGRVVFGALYGLGNFVLFTVLGRLGVPDFYDKLLPVPILNLLVPWIDRAVRSGPVQRVFRGWDTAFASRKANLVHMGVWIALFVTLLSTGFVQAPHPGASLAFWKKAYDAGNRDAGRNWMKLVGAQAEAGNAAACNQLGLIYLEGKLTARDPVAAAHYFTRACGLGDVRGCENSVAQLLESRDTTDARILPLALDHLEQQRARSPGGAAAYLLGYAQELGRGRPPDPRRAADFYREACAAGHVDASKGLVRLVFAGVASASDASAAAAVLERAAAAGDALGSLYLAHLHHAGAGVARDEARARALLARACEQGSKEACAAAARPDPWEAATPASGGR
jgi:TPR repeat protein